MAEFPALPLWTDALLGDTTHLSTIEFGAYMLTLIVAWRTPDCSLPDDDQFLGRITRDPKHWPRIKARVMAFWTLGEDGRWRQKRLTKEREYVANLKKKRADAGREGAAKRWQEADGNGDHGTELVPVAGIKSRPSKSSNSLETQNTGMANGIAPIPTPTPIPTPKNKKDSLHATTTGGQRVKPQQGEEEEAAVARYVVASQCDPNDAKNLAVHFCSERSRLWPGETKQPSGPAVLKAQAERYLRDGAPVDLVSELLTAQMEKSAKAGASAPMGLTAYSRSLPDALAKCRIEPDESSDGYGGKSRSPQYQRPVSISRIMKAVMGDDWRYGEEVSGTPSDDFKSDATEISDDEISNEPELLLPDRSKGRPA